MTRLLIPLLLLTGAAVAEEQEVLREEAYNYRIVGRLPVGWKRDGTRLAYTFRDDGIPHAHVVFARQRVRGRIEVAREIEQRRTHYRFPATPKGEKGTVTAGRWAGRQAWLYDLKTTVRGVACRRRVTILFTGRIWYELIETHYGSPKENCRAGLAVFRDGFRLLVEPLAKGAEEDAAERTITSKEFGFRIVKPRGFLLRPVSTAADPGVRVHFERKAQNGRRHARVRLFEFAARRRVVADKWFAVFFSGFTANNNDGKREKIPAPGIVGTKNVWAERFTGTRDKLPIRTLVVIAHAESGRVFVLRIRTQADADTAFKAGLEKVLSSFRAG